MSTAHRALRRARRDRVVLSHQCPFCNATGVLQTIRHPSGTVIYCRRCSRSRKAPEVLSAAS